MAQIKTNLQYGTTGTVQSANVADDAVTLAKMASGTDGNVITYDASGNPAVVSTGSSGQLLKSQGAGSVPVFATVAGFDVSSITGATALAAQPAETDEIVLSDAGTLKRLDITHIQNTPIFAATMSAAQTNETSNVLTKIEFDTEALDTGGVYDTSNYRWTPGVAGWYYINTSINFGDNADDAPYVSYSISLKLSGSIVAGATEFNTSEIFHGLFENVQAVSWMGYMSDSNYIEVFGKVYNNAWDVHTASSWFQGFRITGV